MHACIITLLEVTSHIYTKLILEICRWEIFDAGFKALLNKHTPDKMRYKIGDACMGSGYLTSFGSFLFRTIHKSFKSVDFI